MERVVVQLHGFTRELDQLINSGKLLSKDFEDFEWKLIHDPQMGDVIPGLNGLRKIRLKSSTKGKRGGFRVDYLDFQEEKMLMFLVIYSKNEKSDLSSEEKKKIASKVLQIKDEVKRLKWVKCLTH